MGRLRPGAGGARPRDLPLVAAAGGVDLLVWSGDSELAWGGSLPLWVVPALTVPMAGALLLRRSLPVAVFALQVVYSLINFATPGYFPFACLLVALYSVACRTTPATARIALLTIVVPLGAFVHRSGVTPTGYDWRLLFRALAAWTLIATSVWGLGRLMYARERQARAEQARLTLEAEQAVQAERLRLARELHDSVSGTVSGMILQAAGARTLSNGGDERVGEALRAIQDAGQQAMTELHRMLGLLRTPESAAGPRLAEIDALVERARAAGLGVTVETHGDPRPLDPEIDLTAYRIVQEALTNAVRHAGAGASVLVVNRWGADRLGLEIRSAGGAGPATDAAALSTGNGLRGLRERVDLVGGTVDAGRSPGGWSVRAGLPCAPARPAAVPTPAVADTTIPADPDVTRR